MCGGRMTPASSFDVTNRATWPEVLSLAEVAAIYRKAPSTVQKACERRTFFPTPAYHHPLRWKKAHVLRELDGPTHRLRRSA